MPNRRSLPKPGAGQGPQGATDADAIPDEENVRGAIPITLAMYPYFFGAALPPPCLRTISIR